MTPAGAPDYPTNPKASHGVRIAFCVSDEQLEEGLARLVRFAQRCRVA
jgi:aspartate/methionine/tyrosine aminotransferase